MKQYLEVISKAGTGGEELSRAGLEATKRERSDNAVNYLFIYKVVDSPL